MDKFEIDHFKRVVHLLLKNNLFRILLVIFVFLFTFILRAHNYDRTPPSGHLEEHLYAWAGLYLIETGTPVSWSTLDYPKNAQVYSGKIDYHGSQPSAYVTLVKPWLDEPPLFSLIVGEVAHLYHADRHFIIPSSYIRLPVIFFAALSSILIFFIARFVSGYWIGVLSMFLYGTIPTLVDGSRLAVPENLIALLYLATILLLLHFRQKSKVIYLIFIPLLAGIGGLSKPTGFFIIFIAMYFAFAKRRYGWMIYLLVATIPFVVFYFWYGLHFSPEIFWRINSIQGQRPVGFSSLAWIFTSPSYDIKIFLDSWYVFGLLFAFYFIIKPEDEKKRLISFFLVYWILVVMFSGGEGDLLPWYRYPFFPLLAITAAWGIEYVLKNINFLTSFISIGFLLGNRHLLVNAFRPNIMPNDYRIVTGGLLFPSLLHSVHPWKILHRISQIIIVGVLCVGIYFNISYIYNQFELNCESQSCPFGPSTWLSTLHFPLADKWITLGDSALH